MEVRAIKAPNYLKRFWIRFDISQNDVLLWPLRLGCGVTAFDREDALEMIHDRVMRGGPLQTIVDIIEDVDVSTLDPRHVLPNMGLPIERGIWFPLGYGR